MSGCKMRIPKLKGVRVIDKPERSRHEDRDLYEKSSKIIVYNIFEQDWSDLQAEGLTYLFGDDKSEFERRKEEAKCKKEMAEESETIEITELTEVSIH